MSDNCSIVLVNKVKFIWHYKECLNHSQPKKSHKCDTWLDLLPPPRRLSFQPCPFVGWFVSWITQKPQNGLLQNLDWGNVSAQIGSQELFVWTLIKAWIQEFFLTFLVCARHFSNFWLISLGAMHRSWRKLSDNTVNAVVIVKPPSCRWKSIHMTCFIHIMFIRVWRLILSIPEFTLTDDEIKCVIALRRKWVFFWVWTFKNIQPKGKYTTQQDVLQRSNRFWTF